MPCPWLTCVRRLVLCCRQGLHILKVTGIVRAFPIIYYSKRARNAMINYAKTLPAVLLWIGMDACLATIAYL